MFLKGNALFSLDTPTCEFCRYHSDQNWATCLSAQLQGQLGRRKPFGFPASVVKDVGKEGCKNLGVVIPVCAIMFCKLKELGSWLLTPFQLGLVNGNGERLHSLEKYFQGSNHQVWFLLYYCELHFG